MFRQSMIEVPQTCLWPDEKMRVPLDDSSVRKSDIGCDRLAHWVLSNLTELVAKIISRNL